MTDLAKLVVRLEAETSKYQSELEKAEKRLSGFERNTNEAARKIGVAAGAATAAAVLGYGAMVKAAIDAADEGAKLARSTGLTTEALSELQYVAGQSGVEDLGGSLVKFNKAIVEAAEGSKAQQAAFADLGVKITDANGKIRRTEDILSDAAEGFAGYGDGAKKSSLAMDLFGKTGAEMISFLSLGKKGLAEGREEARLFGQSIGGETAAASEQFNDNLSRMGALAQGVANQTAAELAPALAKVTDRFVEAAKKGDLLGRASAAISTGFKIVVSGALIVSEAFASTGRQIGAVAAAFIAASRGEFAQAWRILKEGAADVKTGYVELKGTIADLWAETDKLAVSSEQAAQKADAPYRRIEASAKAATVKVAELSQQTKDLMALEEQQRAEAKQLSESVRTPIESYNAEVARIEKVYGYGFSMAEDRTRALTKANDDYLDSIGLVAPKLEETGESLSVYAEQAAKNSQDAFAEFLFDPFENGTEGMVDSFAKALQRMAANAAAAKLFDALNSESGGFNLTNFLGSLIGVSASAPVAVGAVDFANQDPFGAVQYLPGRAHGGRVSANDPYMVGERGKELFVPDVSGLIVPNQNIGGSTVNNYLTIQSSNGMVSPATQQQLMTKMGIATQRAMRRNA